MDFYHDHMKHNLPCCISIVNVNEFLLQSVDQILLQEMDHVLREKQLFVARSFSSCGGAADLRCTFLTAGREGQRDRLD